MCVCVTKSLKGSYMFGKCVGFGQCLHKRGRNGRFLWAAQNVVKWYENMGENKKIHVGRLQNQLVFQVQQTISSS